MSKNEPTKMCRKCKPPKEKPLSEFAINNRSRMNAPEGRKEICKKCAWEGELERRKQAIACVAAERVNIPERLVNYRERLDLTQERAARKLGMPLGTYLTYEQGRRVRQMNEKTYKHIIEQTRRNKASEK
jgi:DNA-binding transcriptional regulator YiaG